MLKEKPTVLGLLGDICVPYLLGDLKDFPETFWLHVVSFWASLVAQSANAVQETWVWSLGWENRLEEGMATYSSVLTWRIPWTGEPGGLQTMGLQRVRHDWVTKQQQQQQFHFTFWFQSLLCTEDTAACVKVSCVLTSSATRAEKPLTRSGLMLQSPCWGRGNKAAGSGGSKSLTVSDWFWRCRSCFNVPLLTQWTRGLRTHAAQGLSAGLPCGIPHPASYSQPDPLVTPPLHSAWAGPRLSLLQCEGQPVRWLWALVQGRPIDSRLVATLSTGREATGRGWQREVGWGSLGWATKAVGSCPRLPRLCLALPIPSHWAGPLHPVSCTQTRL